MKYLNFIILGLLLTTLSVNANLSAINADEFIQKSINFSDPQTSTESYEFELYDKQANEIFRTKKNHIVIKNFPISPSYNVTLFLSKQVNSITKDAQINYFKDGKKVKYNRQEMSSYYGYIDGENNSDVFISYNSLGLSGFIKVESGQIYDIHADFDELNNDIITHRITKTTTEDIVNGKPILECGNDLLEDSYPHFKENKILEDLDEEKTPFLEIKMAADANFEYYLKFCQFITKGNAGEWEDWFGDITQKQHEQAIEMSLDYMDLVMSAVARVYVREHSIIIKTPYITLFNDPFEDPYFKYFGSDLEVELDAMSSIWAKRTDEATDRTLATVFTDLNRQNQVAAAGIAYAGRDAEGVLCSKGNGYSVLGSRTTSRFPGLKHSADIGTASHEFGHNFGSPHTHSCYWQRKGFDIIDSCATGSLFPNPLEQCLNPSDRRFNPKGTVMSYCHQFNSRTLNFHFRTKKIMRDNAEEAMQFCIKTPSEPIVKLIEPLGEDSYFAGEEVNIKFNAANVPLSKLFFSTNNGSDWNEIGTVNTAEDTSFRWTVPYKFGSENRIRIESVTNADIFDQSIVPFTINDLSIRAEHPKPSTKLGYLSDHNLSWSRNNVENVAVKYSTNNGKSFETVTNNTDESSVIFNFPDVATKKAIFRVESVDFSNTVMEVLFELGRESIIFDKPMFGDVLNVNRLEKKVRFNQDFFEDEFDIWFRKNQTGDWVKLNNFVNKVDIENKVFLWKFSSDIKQGNTGELEARLTSGEVVGETGVFSFDATSGVELSRSKMFNINSITPNPAINTFKLVISNAEERLVNTNIRIIGVDGKEYKKIRVGFISTGKTPIEIDVDDLLVGTYYIMIESDKYKDVQQLKVVR